MITAYYILLCPVSSDLIPFPPRSGLTPNALSASKQEPTQAPQAIHTAVELHVKDVRLVGVVAPIGAQESLGGIHRDDLREDLRERLRLFKHLLR